MTSSTRLRRFRTVGSALAAAALAVAALTAPPAGAATNGPPDGHDDHHEHGRDHGRDHGPAHRYLALGDSLAFGYEPPETTPPADYLRASNFRGYPEVTARRLGLRVANASCPGETTASLIDATAQSNGCENSLGSPVGYRTVYPLHRSYQGSQLDYAVRYLRQHRRTRLVSINVGSNDLFLCQRTTPDRCTGTELAGTVEQVRANLDTILSTLRSRAHYHHRVVVLTYYSLDYGDPVGTAVAAALDDAIAAAARAHRATVADGFGAFRRASAGSGGDVCAAGLIIALPSGGCNVHPTPKGDRVLARAVVSAVHH